VWEIATGQPMTPPLPHGDEVYWVSFSPDGRTLLTACRDGTARLWDLDPDRRPGADLVLAAQVLAGCRLDAFGAVEALTPAEQREALARLRELYPAEFHATTAEVLAWHRFEIHRSLHQRNYAGALYHALHCDPAWWFLSGRPPG
jgi:WD40 repeat protein